MALLLHTGGTIGMTSGPDGLRPERGLVEAAVARSLSHLKTHVFDPLLDSADIGPGDWNRILDVIDYHPETPVLMTHGTDTLSFTGAALSQALAGSKRRVILCASMMPLGQGGDAEGNIDLAISSLDGPSGVYLAFDGTLLAAAGLVKVDSHASAAFVSVPQPPLPIPARRRFDNRKLAILTISPGLQADVLAAMLAPLDGAVLRVFGAGTIMSDPAVIHTLSKAAACGKRLRIVSQCVQGGLSLGTYAAGSALGSSGMENGGQETPEAALVHLWLNDF